MRRPCLETVAVWPAAVADGHPLLAAAARRASPGPVAVVAGRIVCACTGFLASEACTVCQVLRLTPARDRVHRALVAVKHAVLLTAFGLSAALSRNLPAPPCRSSVRARLRGYDAPSAVPARTDRYLALPEARLQDPCTFRPWCWPGSRVARGERDDALTAGSGPARRRALGQDDVRVVHEVDSAVARRRWWPARRAVCLCRQRR